MDLTVEDSVPTNNNINAKPQRPSLAKILLSLDGTRSKQAALLHVLHALHILYAREAIVRVMLSDDFATAISAEKRLSLDTPADSLSPLLSPEEPTPRVDTSASMVSTLELNDIGLSMTDSITRASEVSCSPL
jgi:E3 ubiquitin-protein ligase HERC2